jgi:cell division septation protein DedD
MAEEDVKRMKKRGYAAFIKENEIPEKGTWYRVRVGSFKNRASAERLAGELKSKEGLEPFITVE